MEGPDPGLEVEVAYALPAQQVLVTARVQPGATVREAIQASGILEAHPEIDLDANKVGIFGRLTGLDHPVEAGDRIEIYRPLLADPKEVRRLRAAQGKALKKGGGQS